MVAFLSVIPRFLELLRILVHQTTVLFKIPSTKILLCNDRNVSGKSVYMHRFLRSMKMLIVLI